MTRRMNKLELTVAHPQSGINIYFSPKILDELGYQDGQKFFIHPYMEGNNPWIFIKRAPEESRGDGRYGMTETSTPGRMRLMAKRITLANGRTVCSHPEIPQFGQAVPLGWQIDGDSLLIEMPAIADLPPPQNQEKAVTWIEQEQYKRKFHSDTAQPHQLSSDVTHQPTLMQAQLDLQPPVDDERMALKKAVALVNWYLENDGDYHFCVKRDGQNLRIFPGDVLRVTKEEDL